MLGAALIFTLEMRSEKNIIDRQYRATVYLNDEEEGRSAVLQDSSMLTVLRFVFCNGMLTEK